MHFWIMAPFRTDKKMITMLLMMMMMIAMMIMADASDWLLMTGDKMALTELMLMALVMMLVI